MPILKQLLQTYTTDVRFASLLGVALDTIGICGLASGPKFVQDGVGLMKTLFENEGMCFVFFFATKPLSNIFFNIFITVRPKSSYFFFLNILHTQKLYLNQTNYLRNKIGEKLSEISSFEFGTVFMATTLNKPL